MPQETELKLALPTELADRIAGLACVSKRLVSPERRRIAYRATYFDTPDHDLAKSRSALRLRRESTGWVQTLKLSPVEGLGLTERVELNWPVSRFGLDLVALDQSPLAERSDWASVRSRLKRRFTTQFIREAMRLQWPDGSEVELALDRGVISAGHRPVRSCLIQELEIELVRGESDCLWELAFELSEQGPTVPMVASKAQRGYELLEPPALPRKAKPNAPAQASHYAAVLGQGLSHALLVLHHNLRHVRRDDPEFIHQARVALRRLRSLLRGAEDFRGPSTFHKAIRRLKGPLRALGQRLGEVRDADVLVNDTLPRLRMALAPGLHAELDTLLRQALLQRDAAYDALLSMWYDPMMGRALLMTEHFIARLSTQPQWDALRAAHDLVQIASRQLTLQHEALMRASRDLSRQSVEQLHALRIQGKRMRYLLDFWTTLWGKSELKAYRSGLVGLVESLGAISDDATALIALQHLKADAGLLESMRVRANQQCRQRLPSVAAALVELDLATSPWRA
jgi:inorganic triphosphatase YgiF